MKEGATDATETPSATAGARRGGIGTFSSLRYRDYRLLWIGILFMSAGQWVQQVTLGWLVYDLTRSGSLLGALNGLRSLPFLLGGPLAGVMVDRIDRRRLLMWTQLLLFITTLTVGLMVYLRVPGVWYLFVFTLISGIAWSINQPLRQALISLVVPKSELMNAVALSSAGFNIMKIVGPALAGLLILWFGAAGNFLVQATAYAIVFMSIFAMQIPASEARSPRGSAWSDLVEGLRFVVRTPIVLALMISSVVLSVFGVPYVALMPVFQVEVLGVGPEALGLMTAAPGVGAVISTLTLASIANRVARKGVLLLGSLLLLGCGLVVYAQMTLLVPALAALVVVGGAQILCLSVTLTMIQVSVPDALRGRVMSIAMMDRGLTPLGTLLAGLLVDSIGAPATVTLMGGLVIGLTVVTAVCVPPLRRFTQ